MNITWEHNYKSHASIMIADGVRFPFFPAFLDVATKKRVHEMTIESIRTKTYQQLKEDSLLC